MLIACWGAKGGVGTTVVSAVLAAAEARRTGSDVWLADLAGDLPAAVGSTAGPGPGLAGWMAAGADVPNDALVRLSEPVGGGVRLIERGKTVPVGSGDRLAAALAALGPCVVDCGLAAGPAAEVAANAMRSVLVTRLCYLALRRAAAATIRPTEVIVVAEAGRALSTSDVADVIGAPVVAEIPVDASVARAVDAGVLLARPPARLLRRMPALTR